MANQLAYLESLALFNKQTLFGGTCAFAAELTDTDVMFVFPLRFEISLTPW